MNTKKTMTGLITLALLAFIGLAALQYDNDSESVLADTEYDIEVEVNGLHCSMCERSSRRSFEGLEQVEKVTIKLDHGVAFIKLKEGQTVTKEQVTEAIENAGFQAGEFKKFPGDE